METSDCLCAVQDWESPDYEPSLPVSEKSNPLTRDIDRASANEIVRMLQACDRQMFETGSSYPRLLSAGVLQTLVEVAQRAELLLQDPEDGLVLLSGCGTSGRIAFLTASSFNRELRGRGQRPLYAYIMAGGDRALFSSHEAPEDDPALGVLSLQKACEGKRRVLFIGISCGLSAPFVAAQLDFCLQQPDRFTPVLIGFNPTNQARDESVPGASFTFLSVVETMMTSRNAFIINPAVGPEAISGSSRMKGGSATKLLLEAVLTAAHAAAFAATPVTSRAVLQQLEAFRSCLDVTYAQSHALAALLEAAGRSLRRGGRVCYLGWGAIALLGLVDASECVPTFGADHEDIRGFIRGGFSGLRTNEGPPRAPAPGLCVSHEDFLRDVLPSLDDGDTVLLLYSHSDDVEDVLTLARKVREKTSNVHAVYHQLEGDTGQEDISDLCLSSLKLTWPSSSSESLLHMQWDLSTKLVLNAVSSGAHVLKGSVYLNYMLDLQVTNRKLFSRAGRLLQCDDALLKVLYQVDVLPDDITLKDVSSHTRAAGDRKKVVPLALVCLLTGCSLKEAESHLEQRPIVREAVEACLSHDQPRFHR